MKTRFLKVATNGGRTYFVPQYEVGAGVWIEFIGFDSDSPYLHPKVFDSLDAAKTFARAPGIWNVGKFPLGTAEVVQ